MEKQILGYKWEIIPVQMVQPSEIEHFYYYRNNDIGEFYISEKASNILADFKNEYYKLLSAIYETKYIDKNLCICLEQEKR